MFNKAFTLVEILVAAGISVLLITFVLIVYEHGGGGFSRLNWHALINQQGDSALKTIAELLAEASAPSVVNENGTLVSASLSHFVTLPSGLNITGDARKTILTFPISNPCSESAAGKVTWVSLFLEPEPGPAKTASLRIKRSLAVYGSADFESVNDPNNGKVKTLIENVKSVKFALSPDKKGLSITILAAYPKNLNLTQTFNLNVKLNIPVQVN